MIERKTAERVAREFYETYERLAPSHDETWGASALPWSDVPENIKELQIAVIWELLDRGVIVQGKARI